MSSHQRGSSGRWTSRDHHPPPRQVRSRMHTTPFSSYPRPSNSNNLANFSTSEEGDDPQFQYRTSRDSRSYAARPHDLSSSTHLDANDASRSVRQPNFRQQRQYPVEFFQDSSYRQRGNNRTPRHRRQPDTIADNESITPRRGSIPGEHFFERPPPITSISLPEHHLPHETGRRELSIDPIGDFNTVHHQDSPRTQAYRNRSEAFINRFNHDFGASGSLENEEGDGMPPRSRRPFSRG